MQVTLPLNLTPFAIIRSCPESITVQHKQWYVHLNNKFGMSNQMLVMMLKIDFSEPIESQQTKGVDFDSLRDVIFRPVLSMTNLCLNVPTWRKSSWPSLPNALDKNKTQKQKQRKKFHACSSSWMQNLSSRDKKTLTYQKRNTGYLFIRSVHKDCPVLCLRMLNRGNMIHHPQNQK